MLKQLLTLILVINEIINENKTRIIFSRLINFIEIL